MPSFLLSFVYLALGLSCIADRAPATRLTCPPPVAQSTVMGTSTHSPSSPPAGPKSTAAHTGELARKEKLGATPCSEATTQAPPQAPQKAAREQDEDDDEDEEDDHEAATDGRGRQVMEVEGAEAPGSSGRGRKRQRKTAEQVSVLEAHFSANPLPDKALRDRLGVQLGLTTRQVQIWFQNKVPHPTLDSPLALPRASFGPMCSGPRPSRISSSSHCSHRPSRQVLLPSSPRYAPPRVLAPSTRQP